MDELIAKHLAGETSDLEERALERWRAERPEHERSYRESARTWALTAAPVTDPFRAAEAPGAATSLVGADRPSPGLLLAEADRRRRSRRARDGRRRALRSPLLAYGLGAAAILALLVLRGVERPASPVEPLVRPVESTVSADEVMTLGLSDGSVVRLAPSSTVVFPPTRERREVELRGRAFFAVAPGEADFVVRTDVASVTVRGTRFEVAREPDGLRVVVVEGSVRLAGDFGAIDLAAGHVARLPVGGLPSARASDDVWAELDWAGGILLFQETPLADVAEEIGRHFGLTVLVDEELRARRITAWFADEPAERVLSAVCLVAGASCSAEADTVRVAR